MSFKNVFPRRYARRRGVPEPFWPHVHIAGKLLSLRQYRITWKHFYGTAGTHWKHKQWFKQNRISATINVDDHILNVLLRPEIKALVNHIGCVHFEVTENSNKLLNNALAARSNPQSTTLWLDDFGSGNAGISAIRDYHFDYVKIDKDFFWLLMQKIPADR